MKKLIFCKKARYFLHDISHLRRCRILHFKLLMNCRHIRCIVRKRVIFKMMRSLFNIIRFCLYCFSSLITFNDTLSSFSMSFNRFRVKKNKIHEIILYVFSQKIVVILVSFLVINIVKRFYDDMMIFLRDSCTNSVRLMIIKNIIKSTRYFATRRIFFIEFFIFFLSSFETLM